MFFPNSIHILIIANLVPFFGVLFFQWDIFTIFVIYWAESAIIGFFNVFKIIISGLKNDFTKDGKIPPKETTLAFLIFMAPFFIIHYGGFMLGHLAFIIFIFGNNFASNSIDKETLSVVDPYNLLLSITVLFLSHLFSFYFNYLRKKEYLKVDNPMTQMFTPYKRIVIMHVSILIGGGLAMTLNSDFYGLIILILLKIAIDVYSHKKEHKN